MSNCSHLVEINMYVRVADVMGPNASEWRHRFIDLYPDPVGMLCDIIGAEIRNSKWVRYECLS